MFQTENGIKWSCSYEEEVKKKWKLLTQEGRWSTDDADDGRRPITVGNLSDWRDLKIYRDDKTNKCHLRSKFCRNCLMLQKIN